MGRKGKKEKGNPCFLFHYLLASYFSLLDVFTFHFRFLVPLFYANLYTTFQFSIFSLRLSYFFRDAKRTREREREREREGERGGEGGRGRGSGREKQKIDKTGEKKHGKSNQRRRCHCIELQDLPLSHSSPSTTSLTSTHP